MRPAAALVTLLGSHAAHDVFGEHARMAAGAAAGDALFAENVELLGGRAPAVLEYFAKRQK